MDALLICAAVEEELAPLRAALPDPRLMNLHLAAIGVGPVEAALGASAAFGRSWAVPGPDARVPGGSPAAAILIGTCGAFPGSGLSIGDVVVVRRSLLGSLGAALGLAYIPAPAAVVSSGDPDLCMQIAEAAAIPIVGCATVPAITRDAAGAARLREETGMETEHLEAHAFLRAAERAGVPAACILGVANEVGPNAHEEWKANADRASLAAARALLLWAERRRS